MNQSHQRVTRVGAHRRGEDYQDLVALEIIVDWLGHSERYQWIKLEADEFGSLDDVVALRSDNRLVLKQVKYSNHPDAETDPWTWDALLHIKTERSTSLLQKWSHSLEEARQTWSLEEASVISNRRASPEILQTFRNGTQFIDFDSLQPDIRERIIAQIGDNIRAKAFFQLFHFRLNQPNFDELEEAVKRVFIDQLKGTEYGWRNLKDQVRSWVAFKDRPNIDGFIYLGDAKLAASWNILNELPQEFTLPDDYVLPSDEFHQEILDNIFNEKIGCVVITANPGIGKSSYCSFLYKQLREKGLPVVRHHYYISTSDEYRSPRVKFERAAASLLHDLTHDYRDSLGQKADVNPSPNDIREFLKVSGLYFMANSQHLVVIVDGLDHVWRETDSIEELRMLLDQLLPAPAGVTLLLASQPLDDSLLPPSLLRNAPKNQWLSLSALTAKSVDEWLRHNIQDIPGFSDETPDHIFREMSDAFFQRSNGHPLYLQYSLRALLENNILINTQNIFDLPGCPHQDINQYYEELWSRLNEKGRVILHLFATCQFSWPEKGILDCLRRQDISGPDSIVAFRHVRHLLKKDVLGWQPFHSSLLVFVRTLPEHPNYRQEQLQIVIAWLDSSAPEYLKWGYQWLLQAQSGNSDDLINGTTREWAINAFAHRRSREVMRSIITTSLQQAVKAGQLARAFKIGLLYEHVFFYNNYDFNREIHEILLFPQIALKDDEYLPHRLQNELLEMKSGEVAILAEVSLRLGLEDGHENTQRYMQALNERLRRPTDGSSLSWQDEVYPLLKIAALPAPQGGHIPLGIMDFAARNRKNGYTKEMLLAYGHYLWIYRNTDFIRIAASSKSEALGPQLSLSESQIMYQFAVLHALENNLDLDSTLENHESSSPFPAIYAAIRGRTEHIFGDFQFADEHLISAKHYEHYRLSPPTWTLYYEAFFAFLANHLIGRSEHNEIWLAEIGDHSWHLGFLHHLNSVAGESAEKIIKRNFDLIWFYRQLGQFGRPILYPSHEDFYYVEAANEAFTRISLDCLILASKPDKPPVISKAELEHIFSSHYCNKHQWLNYYIDLRRDWLASDAVDWLFANQVKQFSERIETFPERAREFAVLASVAVIHHRSDQARHFIKLASANMISHGEHKDMLLFQVLESIRAYYQSLSEEDVDRQSCRQWVLSLAPAIAYVDQYTDGDETGGLPRDLAEALAEIAPELLSTYYLWLTDKEEYDDALHVFHVLLRTVDLNNSINQAIAKTAVDDKSLSILEDRANVGDEGAKVIVASLTNYFGEHAFAQAREESDLSFSSAVEKIPPAPQEYAPEKLRDYIAELQKQSLLWENTHIRQWITYWSDIGRRYDVYHAIKAYVDDGGWFRGSDAVFDLALSLYGKETAYNWLVKAHLEDIGWHRYFTIKERAVGRWKMIRRYYPEL